MTDKKEKIKKSVFTVAFMFCATFVFISGVSLAYLSTKSRVEANEARYLKRGILAAAGFDVPEQDPEVEALYDDCVAEKKSAGETIYYEISRRSSGEKIGYVFLRRGEGLWGDIRAALGFSADMKEMTGFKVLEHNETPGLGARITEPWFEDQFAGKMGPFTAVPEGEPDDKDEFDAVTGATKTTIGVKNMLNESIESARKIAGGATGGPEE